MSYTNETTHYGIPLPLGTDKTTPMDYNTAMQEIDTVLFGAKSDSDSALRKAQQVETGLSQTDENVSALAGRVSTLEGTSVTQGNAIQQNAQDIVDVRADALDMIVAKDEGTAQVATVSVTKNEYFRYNDVLYVATQNISVGDTIVPNNNCRATNVGNELYRLRDEGQVIIEATQNETWSQFMKRAFLLLRDVAIEKRVRSTLVYYNTSSGNSNIYHVGGIDPAGGHMEYANIIHAGGTNTVYYNHNNESVTGYIVTIPDGAVPTVTTTDRSNDACADAGHRCFVVIG